MTTLEIKNTDGLIKKIPERLDDYEIIHYLRSNKLSSKHIIAIKVMSNMTDKRMSEILNVSERTLRGYRSVKKFIEKPSFKEKAFILLTLLKHGRSVFGSDEKFQLWLEQENFALGGEKPISFLNSYTGINFIDDRLTGLEYGDNL